MSQAPDAFEVVEIEGVKVPLDPRVLSDALIKALRSGIYERPRRKCLRAMVEADDRIADLGGGLGYISAMMALERRADFIVNVEGHPAVQDLARRVYALNGVEVALCNALAVTRNDAGPTRPLYLSEDFWGSSMAPDVRRPAGSVEVPVMTIGEIVARYAANMLVFDLEVMKTYLLEHAASGPLEAMALGGVNKVVVHFVHQFHGDALAVRRIFDFFAAQGFCYDIDLSRGSVVLFRRLAA
jgi:hypothetical protein